MTFGFRDCGLPWGDARPYPPFPHAYRGVEDAVVAFEAPADGVAAFLPRGVEPDADPCPAQAKFRWTPLSAHGPYHEAYVSATVRWRETRFRFLLLAFTDNESPLVAGREIWGTPKKLGRMARSREGPGGGFADMLAMTLDRPAGLRLMTMGVTLDRPLPEPAAPPLPTLLLKVVPDAANERPALAQLIRIDGQAALHRSADGAPFLFAGRAALSFDATSEADPLYRLRPLRLTGATFARLDFSHGPGRVIHDYLAE
jgi:acetoacetate decarboxylase